MEENHGTSNSDDRAIHLVNWQPGEVWFREWIPRDQPWGREEVLDEVPDEAKGHYALILGESTTIDDVHHNGGSTVVAGSRSHFERLLFHVRSAQAVGFPWYDRLVPMNLMASHTRPLDQASSRAGYRDQFSRALSITLGIAAAGYFLEQLRFYALLLATMYGLGPLVEAGMALLQRADNYSVQDLNRKLVNHVFFSKWITAQRSRILKVGVGLLVIIFIGQVYAGLGPSFQAAALVKDRVRFDGEWWRMVTAGLMHGSFLHILFNGMALYSFGRFITGLVYPPMLAFVFLFSVVTGSMASLYLGQAYSSVGASGGILGCLGFLFIVTGRFQHVLPNFLRRSLIQSIIVIAIFGLLGSAFIDNAAHAGGFAGGVFLGFLLDRPIRLGMTTAGPVLRVLSVLSMAVLALGAVKIAWELWKIHSAL